MTIDEEMVRRQVWWRKRHEAISIAELERRTRLRPRAIKAAVEGLRLRHSLAIGSSRGKGNGYFGVMTAEDIEHTVHTLMSQAIQMIRVAHALPGPKQRRLLELAGQMELELQQ